MAKNKTQPTDASVDAYIAATGDETRQSECKALVKLMSKVTGHPPRMWGPSIVGFGTYHYKYASGHEGDMCVAGFASRGLLARLGKHRMTKVCLYIRRLSDVDPRVLQQLVAGSAAETRRRHG